MAERENEKKHKKCTCDECREEKVEQEEKEHCECDCEECTCEQPKDNYLEIAQRIQAEFDNYRKRSADVVKIAKQDGVIEAIEKFLPALDSFKKAKKMIKDEAVLEGVNLVEKEIMNSLKELEVEEIDAKGQQFDPNYHNVVAVKNDNSFGDGIIVEVYQAGYKLKDKIFRYAQVIVNKNKKEEI
ncbi:MAG: nucleotide exchange factor GrpE [Clostridia bacterium]|nr:nucleotide exchange factor GrpE [Clostridia bacterium]